VVVELGDEPVEEEGPKVVLLAAVTVEFLLALPVAVDTLEEPVEVRFVTAAEADDETAVELGDDESVVEADTLITVSLALVEAAVVANVEDSVITETVLDDLMVNSGVKLTLLVLVSSTISRA